MLRCFWLTAVPLLVVGSGCAHRKAGPPVSVQVAVVPEEGVPSDWRSVARPTDQAQIDAMAALWASALSEAAKADTRAVLQEGALLRADSALPRATPTPGLYRCRSIAIGPPAKRPAGAPVERALTRSKPFGCVVTAERTFLGFTRVSGDQRPGGYLWPEGDTRMIFLGGTAERDGEGASAYGGDSPRNRFGVFERIGEFRWRLVLIAQPTVSRLDVIELVPAVAIPVRATR